MDVSSDVDQEPERTPKSGRRRMRSAGRRTADVIREIDYPHNIHPALVPGVAIEDQRVRYGIDRPIVAVVGTAIIGFVIWGILDPAGVEEISGIALGWVTQNLGWVFNVLATGMAVFLLVLAFSRHGRIPLGLDGEKQEYSTVSWVAMLFAAGIGIGIIFFGPFEPLSHYLDPLPGLYEPDTTEAIRGAMAQAALHWGINAWAIYAIVGLCVAYVSFRRGRVPLMSSVLTPCGTDRPAAPVPA